MIVLLKQPLKGVFKLGIINAFIFNKGTQREKDGYLRKTGVKI